MTAVPHSIDGQTILLYLEPDQIFRDLLHEGKVVFNSKRFESFGFGEKNSWQMGDYHYKTIGEHTAVITFRPKLDSGDNILVDLLLTFDDELTGMVCADVYSSEIEDADWHTPRSQLEHVQYQSGEFEVKH